MAKGRKQHIPPPCGKEITAPKALTPLMQAFHVDSEKAAKALIQEAAHAIYGGATNPMSKEISKEELSGIALLMKGIKPRDTLETLYAAQIVASHMLGMRKLSDSFKDDQDMGLKLLRFSNEAMQQLDKKRNGGSQNITVNYNYSGNGTVLTKTDISAQERKDAN